MSAHQEVIAGGIGLAPRNIPLDSTETHIGISQSKINHGNPDESIVTVTVSSPILGARMPTDLVIVVDVSGSMGADASASGVESSGLSVLDVVKHAVKTIINVLGPNDRLSVVSYSDNATIVFESIEMNAAGKATAQDLTNRLHPGGMTNLWDGLHKGMEILTNRSASQRRSNSAIFLLTDGDPNIEPPRGHIPMLQRYKDTHAGQYPGVISTFGFGYTMDSPLLSAISHEGDGIYAFIPDSGFVGTAFVNALGNVLTTTGVNATLTIEAINGASIIDVVGIPAHTKQSWGIAAPLGALRFGQTKDFVVKVRNATGGACISASVKFDKLSDRPGQPAMQTRIEADGPGINCLSFSTDHAELERCRSVAVAGLKDVIEAMVNNRQGDAQRIIRDVVTDIRQSVGRLGLCSDGPSAGSIGGDQSGYREKMEGLAADFEGQITQAASRTDWFQKWGKHYLPSLQRAHELQQCSNFKDPGVLKYGGYRFNELRDIADDVFNALPAPTPSGPPRRNDNLSVSAPGSAPRPVAAPLSMSSFNSAAAPCFHGSCKILLANGGEKSVADINKGDLVFLGNDRKIVAEVKYIVKTIFFGSEKPTLVVIKDRLIVTPWHPIRIDGSWKFPCDVPDATLFNGHSDSVYSFVVKVIGSETSATSYGMMIESVECITLGNQIENDPVASHPYLSSKKVVSDIAASTNGSGILILEGGNAVVRDETSNLIVGFIPYSQDSKLETSAETCSGTSLSC